jgi:putative ABC transport system permease protein
MGIIGVLGSLVLLITGLGMKNSLDYTVSYTYSSFYTYNTKIDLYDPAVTANTLGISDEVQYLQEQGVEIKSNSNQKYTALLSIIGNGNFVWIRESDGRQTNISDTNGIIISEKFAETLNVSEGDEISWRLVGGEWKSIKIGRIIIHSLPRSMLVSEESWKYSGQDFVGNVILTETKTDDLNLDKNLIKKVQSIDKQEESMQAVCDSTASIIYLLIFVAILLATVVLSGLGLLNFTEMSREYATLKVIGLYPSEIRNLAFTENLILSLIGWIIGLPIAKWFVDVYMKLLSNDTIVCIPKVKTITYVAASAMVLLCSIGINLLLSIKVNKIDMVSALKSME